jgi:hypothetical protein
MNQLLFKKLLFSQSTARTNQQQPLHQQQRKVLPNYTIHALDHYCHINSYSKTDQESDVLLDSKVILAVVMMNAQMDNIAVKMIMDAINALVRNINIIMTRNIL